MGNSNSAHVQKIFTRLNSDNSGEITLDQILQVQNLPDVENWSSTHSPLLLYRFDQAHDGTINREEFDRLLKYLQIANKKAQQIRSERQKKALSPKGMKRSGSQVWTCVSQATASSFNLSRDEPPPMITGNHRDGSEVDEVSELNEDELRELIQTEAKQFFSGLLRTKEGRTQFLNWLFLLADVDRTNTISVDELSLVLSALSNDGLVPDYLDFDPINPKASAESIMEDYDTTQTGSLTKEEFVKFGDMLLKCYECSSSEDGDESHRIGKYQLKRIIGKGSSGVVWLGMDTEKKVRKAIKVIPIGDVSDMSRVDVEIKAMLMLKHRNIVSLEEVLETDENVYFIMELCGGGCLSDRVAEEPFNEETARYYFLKLLDAVKYCHGKGVCHRDLKLENLLLDNDGHLKVTDFGHAGIFSRGWDVFSTGMMGSLLHISPEQIEGKCYHGEKIDIWALGVLLYRMVVGSPPFFSNDPDEFVKSIMEAKFQIPHSMSPELAYLLQKILRSPPEKRLTLDQILQEPWCKGTKLLPTLQTEYIYLDASTKPVDSNACWTALKDVTTGYIHMMEHPPPPNEPTAIRMVKCYYPKKEVKFTILNKVEEEGPFLQFNLKQGEGFDFHRMVNKTKAKLTHTAKLKLRQVSQMRFSEAEDFSSDSDGDSHTPSGRLRNSGYLTSSGCLANSGCLTNSGFIPLGTSFDPAETAEPPPSLSQDRAIS